MKVYKVGQYIPDGKTITVEVPASKSILNRALLLSAVSNGNVLLKCGSFGEDTRAVLGCLQSLGIETEFVENGLLVHGCAGQIPKRNAELNVMSAGTAARFLTTMLAFCRGNYRFLSSEQMERRPMEHLKLLENVGVHIEYEKQPYHFPFRMISNGLCTNTLTVDTDESTQYASGILMAASIKTQPFHLYLTGSRTKSSYISITLATMRSFGIPIIRNGNEIIVSATEKTPFEYAVEPDISGACYFYALALLLGIRVLVKDVRLPSIQGDIAFLRLLEARGVIFEQKENGLLADGTNVKEYTGFVEDLKDFSDQTLTLAALAPFASTPSILKNVGHIRFQECDRIAAICENLTAIGIPAQMKGDDIEIQPAPVKGGIIHTFNDHRVAMAFALIGLKTGNIVIENPDCCKKTFDNYFEILSTLKTNK